MKTIAYAFGLVAALAGCGSGNDASPDGAGAALSAREQTDLLHLREEEKLARDVYDALDPNGQPFVNIQDSEQRHFDAVGGLLATYGVDDPAAGNGVGVFTDAGLQALHDDLVARGAASRLAALGVGCAIEELDLRDLDLARAASDHADVIGVYDSLARGSRNHLRSYFDTLTAAGGSYTPVAIDQATFDAIVTSPREPGGS